MTEAEQLASTSDAFEYKRLIMPLGHVGESIDHRVFLESPLRRSHSTPAVAWGTRRHRSKWGPAARLARLAVA